MLELKVARLKFLELVQLCLFQFLLRALSDSSPFVSHY